MPICKLCGSSGKPTQKFLNYASCAKHFHADCLKLSPSDSNALYDNWSCQYCVKDGRVLRSRTASGSTSVEVRGSSAPISAFTSNQFDILMNKLSKISDDVSEIKSTQHTLKEEISQCRSILEKHSLSIDEHSTAINRHETTLSEHQSDILLCQSDVKSVIQSQSKFEDSIRSLEVKIDQINTNVDFSNRSQPQVLPDQVEILERVRRAHNILVRGVPESSKEEDATIVGNLLDYVEHNASSSMINNIRVGRRDPLKPRPIKVSFTNPMVVSKILRNKKKVARESTFSCYSISDDKTPQQVSELSCLRKELASRRGAGEEGIDIKYINGAPKIIKINKNSPKN